MNLNMDNTFLLFYYWHPSIPYPRHTVVPNILLCHRVSIRLFTEMLLVQNGFPRRNPLIFI